MLRLAFFLLLITNIAVGVYFYLNASRGSADVPSEVNAEKLKIVSVTESGKALQEAQAARKLAGTLTGSGCVDFSVKPADIERAQPLFVAMQLGERLSSRNVEEFSRFSIVMPPQADKKTADALVASIKKAGVKDVSVVADNALSLGVFSTEEAAKRGLSDLKKKAGSLVKEAAIAPRNAQLKETIFTIKEPDINMVARLTLLQSEFKDSTLKAVACSSSAASAVSAPLAEPAKN